jgi:hypothetical protein
LGAKTFTKDYIDISLGVILKSDKDITNIRRQGIDSILNEI